MITRVDMHIKSKIRSILGNLLAKSGDQFADRAAVKNVKFNSHSIPAELNTYQSGGFIRILTTDDNNAKQIKERIEHHRDELSIISVHVADRAIEYFRRSNQEPFFHSSVIVKVAPKILYKSAIGLQDKEVLKKAVLDSDHKSEQIVIDYSSPNIAKPFHFGHLKSTILGNFLANLYRLLGEQVTRLNYIGDWGTQYGILSLGLEKFNEANDRNLNLKKLVDVYSRANEVAKSDENFYEEAKRRFLLMDKYGDNQQIKQWRQIRDLSLAELKNSYRNLGLNFDVFDFESEYADSADNLVALLRSKNLVEVEGNGLISVSVALNDRITSIPFVKSDGTSLYLSRDVAAAIRRRDRFAFDKMLYVAGADQEKHFSCLRQVIKSLELDWYEDLIHVKLGKVIGMSTRSGNFVLLSDIVEEATRRYIESTKNTPTTKVNSKEEIGEVGRQLALSSLYVYDMRNRRTRNYDFDWNNLIQHKNRSGIHLQTTYARLSNLLDRARSLNIHPLECPDVIKSDAICCSDATDLLTVLDEIDNEMFFSYHSKDPCFLVNHALSLCNTVNRARQSQHLWVIGEKDEKLARSRLSLFKIAHSHLEMLIKLIGLQPLKRV